MIDVAPGLRAGYYAPVAGEKKTRLTHFLLTPLIWADFQRLSLQSKVDSWHLVCLVCLDCNSNYVIRYWDSKAWEPPAVQKRKLLFEPIWKSRCCCKIDKMPLQRFVL